MRDIRKGNTVVEEPIELTVESLEVESGRNQGLSP